MYLYVYVYLSRTPRIRARGTQHGVLDGALGQCLIWWPCIVPVWKATPPAKQHNSYQRIFLWDLGPTQSVSRCLLPSCSMG